VDRFEAGEDLKGLEQSLTQSNPDLLAHDYQDGQAEQYCKRSVGSSL